MFSFEADVATVMEAVGVVVLVTDCIDDPGVGAVFATANTGPKTLVLLLLEAAVCLKQQL